MKLSVAICTYNGSKFLFEQLESIAKQTRLPDELVVCDDRSTDASVEIVREFASSVPFPVRVFVNSENLGSTRNFEQAIRFCEGEIIVLADQDDVWLPEKLKRLEQTFVNSPNVGLAFSDAEIVDAALKPTGERMWSLLNFNQREQRAIRNGQALQVLLPGWFVTGATAAFRGTFRELILPIPLDLALIHDGWLGAVISSVADVALIPEPLILYRQHAQQQIGAPESSPETDQSVRAALERSNPYAQQLAITERLLERLTQQSTFVVKQSVLTMLRDRMAHLLMRSALPTNAILRLWYVSGELFSGRYSRFSKGWLSAMKDLAGKGSAD